MVRIYMEFVKSAIIRHIEYILPGAFLLVLLASVSIQNIMNNFFLLQKRDCLDRFQRENLPEDPQEQILIFHNPPEL